VAAESPSRAAISLSDKPAAASPSIWTSRDVKCTRPLASTPFHEKRELRVRAPPVDRNRGPSHVSTRGVPKGTNT